MKFLANPYSLEDRENFRQDPHSHQNNLLLISCAMKPLIQSNKIICGVSVTKNVLLGIYVSIFSFGLLGHPPYPQIPRQRKTCETYLYVYVYMYLYLFLVFQGTHYTHRSQGKEKFWRISLCLCIFMYICIYVQMWLSQVPTTHTHI